MRTILRAGLLLLLVSPAVAAQDSLPPLPADLVYVSEKAEDLVDLCQQGEWSGARMIVDSMSAMEATVESELRRDDMPPSSAYLFDYFLFELREMTRRALQPQLAALAANQITALLIDAQRHYAHSVPPEVSWLDYLGRDVVVLGQFPDDKLTIGHRVAEIDRTWAALKPEVLKRNGQVVAAKVDEVVGHLRSNEARADIIRDGNRLLDLVDELEKIYP